MNGENPIEKNPEELARLIRYYILLSTTEAGSGHPTSSLSAADLMAALFFGGILRFDLKNPEYHNNDRVIFSKGHASPLLYALWAAAGAITERDLASLRKFGSPLEGHPTMFFPFSEAATGSLGQGLSIGVGMALNAKYLDLLSYTTYVLLGDSEMAEGSQWEAMQIAAHYSLDNLTGILDVNRLGQRGETMYGRRVEEYEKKIRAFGWETLLIDGHNHQEIFSAYLEARSHRGKPTMIIAKTVKGKGVSFLEDKEGWHGKTLSKEEFNAAVTELGDIKKSLRGEILPPERQTPRRPLPASPSPLPSVMLKTPLATRRAYGNALPPLMAKFPEIVVLDAETSNSTFSETAKKFFPERFFEMFIAEQNMVGTALGLSRRGKIPFVSTFAAFFTRAFDQIRMCQYSEANIKFAGSHAGVSIGEDGASQMGLEDIAMFRTLLGGVVLYPADGLSTEKLVEEMARQKGIAYLRTTRKDTPVLYDSAEKFPIGGSKTIRQSADDKVTIVAAGITVHEALSACDLLQKEGIAIRVIDLYSIKPLDVATLEKAARETRAIVTVEDHYAEGGIGEAVMSTLSPRPPRIFSLAVRKIPRSGTPAELLDYEEISSRAIMREIKKILGI
jgi:transketolase